MASTVQCPRLRVSRRSGEAVGIEAGDSVGDLAARSAGLDMGGFAQDGEGLSDVGEVEVMVEPVRDPDGTLFPAAMDGLGGLVGEVRRTAFDLLVEEERDIGQEVLLVALDGEQVVGAAAVPGTWRACAG